MLVEFEQNRMVQTTPNCELYDQKKKKKKGFLKFLSRFFLQSVDAILKDVSVAETVVTCLTTNFQTTIFQCFNNYCSPTRVTSLKVHQTWRTKSVLTKRVRVALKPTTISLAVYNSCKRENTKYR